MINILQTIIYIKISIVMLKSKSIKDINCFRAWKPKEPKPYKETVYGKLLPEKFETLVLALLNTWLWTGNIRTYLLYIIDSVNWVPSKRTERTKQSLEFFYFNHIYLLVKIDAYEFYVYSAVARATSGDE